MSFRFKMTWWCHKMSTIIVLSHKYIFNNNNKSWGFFLALFPLTDSTICIKWEYFPCSLLVNLILLLWTCRCPGGGGAAQSTSTSSTFSPHVSVATWLCFSNNNNCTFLLCELKISKWYPALMMWRRRRRFFFFFFCFQGLWCCELIPVLTCQRSSLQWQQVSVSCTSAAFYLTVCHFLVVQSGRLKYAAPSSEPLFSASVLKTPAAVRVGQQAGCQLTSGIKISIKNYIFLTVHRSQSSAVGCTDT